MSRRWPSSSFITQSVCARLAPSELPTRRREAALRAAARSAVETLEDRRLFAVELLPPIVSSIEAPDVTGSPTSYVVTVNYVDDGGLNLDTIDESDISVTGSNGALQVTGVESSGDVNSLQAKYTVTVPGGLPAGRYSVAVRDGEVLDLAGKSAVGVSAAFDVEGDTERPIGTITVADVNSATAPHSVKIVYTDNIGINSASIGADDIAVNGPGGLLTVSGVNVSGSGTEVTAIYTIAAPNGSWATVNGAEYTVLLPVGAVTDTAGNTVPQRTKSFDVNVDASGPSTSINAPDINSRLGPDAYRITVTYEDGGGVNAATAGANDITVTGPAGPLTVSDVSTTTSDDGDTLTVRYTVTAPGGTWDESDNGDYTVSVVAGAVTDAIGNPSAAASKTFQAQVPPPDVTAPVSTIANADLSSAKGSHQVKITFTDDRGLDDDTFDVDNISVTGPAGTVDVTDFSADRQDGGRKYVVTYTLEGPANGEWDHLDNGTYTVTLAAGSVADTSGNTTAGEAKDFIVNIPLPDVEGPAATISVGDVSGPGGATHTVTVTYTDNRNVRESSIGTGDIRVTGPGGDTLRVTGVTTEPDSNSGTIVATYTIAAPGGAWDPTDNGTYTVEVINDEVVDTAGNGVAGASKTFAVSAGLPDGAPPAATIAANDVTTGGGSNHTVVVTYADDAAVDPNSIGTDDVTVSGPIGTLAITTVVINASDNGRTVVATYTVAAPSGGWNYRHNGTYTVTVNADAVRDLTGKPIAAATGTFRVMAPAPQPVDTSWGGGSGNVNTSFVGEAVATTDDGFILVAGRTGDVAAGNAHAVLQRLDGGGNVDTSFGQSGRVVTVGANEAYFAIVTQGSKILVAGTSDGNFLLARFNPDGTPDATFASGGRSITEMGADDDSVYGMALAPDGKIVVTGGSGGNFAFARFTADGAPDLSFDQGGKTLLDLGTATDVPGAVVVQSDGKIVAVGSSGADIAVVRLLSSGLPDASFSGDGLVMVNGLKASQVANFTDRSQALALQADGKILLANHTAAGDNAIARLDGGGNLDGAFGNAGIATVDFAGDDDADAIILQNTGEIMVVGTSLQNGIARTTIAALNQSGTLIDGFGQGGKLVLDALPGGAERELHVGDLVVKSFGAKQADGRIVVGTSNQGGGTQTTSALKRLIVPGTTAAPSGNLIDSFGLVNGKNKKLTIDAGGGKFVTFTMKGGNASVFQDGDALSLVINDDGRGAAVTIKVKGGDGRVKLGNVTTNGSIKSFSARTGDLTGTLAAGVQIGKVTIGDVTGGTIAAGGSIASIAAANLRDARVLAGTGLGSDRQLGGAAADADSYAGGAIGTVKVKGEITNSLIGAGLNPMDGTYGDDDDTIVGTAQLSYIKSISAKLGADESTRFVAAAFKKAKLGKGRIDMATDTRFKTIV